MGPLFSVVGRTLGQYRRAGMFKSSARFTASALRVICAGKFAGLDERVGFVGVRGADQGGADQGGAE